MTEDKRQNNYKEKTKNLKNLPNSNPIKLSRGEICGKFHTPLGIVRVRVIISWQKCDFSLKHLNLYLILKNSVVSIQHFSAHKTTVDTTVKDGDFCVVKV